MNNNLIPTTKVDNLFPRFMCKVIPLAFNESMSYYECLCALLHKVNECINSLNNNSDSITELQQKFIELKNYVDNYFTNLDVQEEINNKLDTMVEDGTLEKLIGDYLTKNVMHKTNLHFYGINIKGDSNSNCFIVKFNNGKNMFIDTGGDYEWIYIKNAIRDLNITKFDYGIITHFHGDHIGNLANFFDTFDLTECQIFTQATDIDWSILPEYEKNFNTFKNIIEANHSSYTSPLHNTITTIDEYTSIRWLNNNSEWYNDYLNTISEYRETENTGNDFSLVAEIIHNNIKILSTGDIEQTAENNLKDYVTKCNLITGCHHLSNRAINWQFFQNCNPDICVSGTSQANMNNTKCEMKEYKFYLSNGRPVYPLGFGLGSYTHFYSNGSSLQLLTPGYSNNYHNTSLYGTVYELVNTIPIGISNLHLTEILDNLQDGEILNGVLWETYLPLYNDLKEIFPFLQNGMLLTIKNTNSKRHHYITIENIPSEGQLYKFTACKKDDIGTHTWNVIGFGTIPRVETYTELTTLLPTLPQGKYTLQYNAQNDPYFPQDGDSYVLDINIFNKGSGNIVFTPRGNKTGNNGFGMLINDVLTWQQIPTTNQSALTGETQLLNFFDRHNYGVYPMYYTVSGTETWLDQDGDNYIMTITMTTKNNGTIVAIPRGKYTKAPVFLAINNGVIHRITGNV